ncbi:dynamin family protein [Nonomuraea sp. NPDC001023]|uniref:dynamin family protein n=1 Tax=unclassified Nonomuraea TaxID=2593643 RepID=UPI003317DE36
MNTAMDDGRHESLGEQTLSFRPVTDDDLPDPRTPTPSPPAAPSAPPAAPSGSPSAASGGPSASGEPSSAAARPSLFQPPPRADEAVQPRRPTAPQLPAASQEPSAGTDEPGPSTGPSLFTPSRPADRPSLFTPARAAEPREGDGTHPRPAAFWERGPQEQDAAPSSEIEPTPASPDATAADSGEAPSDAEQPPPPADTAPDDDEAAPSAAEDADAAADAGNRPQADTPRPDDAPAPEVEAAPLAEGDADPSTSAEALTGFDAFSPAVDVPLGADYPTDPGDLAEDEPDADADDVTSAVETDDTEAGSDAVANSGETVPNAAPNTDADASAQVDAETAADADADAATGGGQGSDDGLTTDAGLDTDTDPDVHPDEDALAQANAETAAADADSDEDAVVQANAAADAETDIDADTDTDSDADTGVEDGAGSEAGGVPEGGQRVEELPAEVVEAMTSALSALRESVSDLRFSLDLPGAEEARQARADLLAQLENYVLPRVRTNTAPALIVIAGSTGAGKSTLVNSLAERNISRTGVRRPTTGTPILACHPDDRKWFAEGELLSGLERLDRPSPDSDTSGLVVVTTEKLPQGVALLDTPDIDSVVEEHHEIAHRMLDAADLWIFVTTAARYADAPAWSLLRLAKERGARLAIVLSRVQPRSADVVLKHFVRMLTEYGLGDIDRFVIHEATVTDGRLPDSEVTDLRMWLAELSVDEARRAQAVQETLNGVLNSFRTRVPALARHLEGQAAFRAELRSDVEAAYLGALAEIDKASKNGSLLHGEVLARWQDFAGSGDLMRSLQFGRSGKAGRQTPERVTAFKAAIRAGLESVIVAAANRAAEEVVARWRHRSELGAKLADGLDRPSDNLLRHAGRAIASWQDHLNELVRTEGVTKRSVSKLVSFDPDALSLIFTVAMFSGGDGSGVPHRLVNALLGAESLRGIGAKALSDLRARIGMLFDEESMRYVHALDSAGIPDESVATRLYQATYNLEVAR